MTDFNMWCWNSRGFPGISPLVVSKNDRVRVRVGNLTMTNHPIHMHGYDFEVTCTDGGWVRPEARWPEVSIDIPVGAMRAYEFDAKYLGDWAIHCHKSHHTMNAMGHDIPTFIGTDKSAVAEKIRKLQPEYMPMGTKGMADMGEMEMPIPENTVPMMIGWGPHGPIEMGGMFSVVKVRDGISADDYSRAGTKTRPVPRPGSGLANCQTKPRPKTPRPKLRRSSRRAERYNLPTEQGHHYEDIRIRARACSICRSRARLGHTFWRPR